MRRAGWPIVVGTLAACSGGASSGSTTPATPAVAPCTGEPAVTLIAPGAEPRVARRYAYTTGRADTLVMTARGTMQYQVDGEIGETMPAPGFALTATMTVGAVEPDGSASIDLDVVDGAWDMAYPEGMIAPATDETTLAASIANLADASATLTVDACGRVRTVVWSLPVAAGVQVKPRVEMAVLALSRLRPALPAEPIGVGATWTLTVPIDESGMKSTEELTYELTAVSPAGSLSIGVRVVDDAKRQSLQESDLVPVPPDILSSRSEGEGEVTLEPSALVPVRGTLKTRNGLHMRVPDSWGNEHDVKGKSTLDTTVERKSTAPL